MRDNEENNSNSSTLSDQKSRANQTAPLKKQLKLKTLISEHKKRLLVVALFVTVLFAVLIGTVVFNQREAAKVSIDELRSTDDIQVFTHFPVDFDEFFAEPEEVLRKFQEHKDSGGAVHQHVSPPFAEFFFDPLNKGIGGRRWGFANPHMPPIWHEALGFEVGEWPSYFVADVTIDINNVRAWYDSGGALSEDVPIMEIDTADLMPGEVNGEEVYFGISFLFEINEHISYGNGGKEWTRKSIIDEIIASDGVASFPAGTLYGYGEGSFGLTDERIDSGGYPGAANPFDYFTTELQEELLALYEPYRQHYIQEGMEPFKDPTDSRQWWDEPGLLAGAWTNNDFMPDGFDLPEGEWREHISLVTPDYIVKETFWRVLEHPWNVENNMAGLWIENQVPYRFYMLDGDLARGVGVAIHPWDPGENGYGWDPLEEDSASNHPSFGKRWYFRFEVNSQQDMWSETVKIERFTSEAAARNGFTGNAVEYKRGFHYR